MVMIIPATGDLRAILINNGAERTNNPIVDLIISAIGVTEMMLGTDISFTSSLWETFVTAKPFELADDLAGPSYGDGEKTVYIKFRDATLTESDIFSAVITLDTTPPAIGSMPILINEGALRGDSRHVTLTLSATGATQIEILNEDDLNMPGGQIIPYSNTIQWTLSEHDGFKEVFVKFIDNIGNETAFFSAEIVLTEQESGNPVIIEPEDNFQTTNHFITIRGTGDPDATVQIHIDDGYGEGYGE